MTSSQSLAIIYNERRENCIVSEFAQRSCPMLFSLNNYPVQSTELAQVERRQTMKGTEIITLNPIQTTIPVFKDERLKKATERITAIYADAAKYADTKNRDIAKILADVADKKSYETDGFKSVADYASTVFGIARQNAYALANAGKVYNDKNAHPELQQMSPSKIAELSSVEPKTLIAALDAGTITHDTTQKALREFAGTSKGEKEEKPLVLDMFIARPCIPLISDEQADTFSVPRTLEDWEEWFTDYVSSISPESFVEVVKLPKGKATTTSSKATINRRLFFNRGYAIVVEFFKYTKPAPSKPKFTKEQLLAMLAEMDDSETSANGDTSK